MAGNKKRHCSMLWSVAVILLLFSLVPGLTCFSLRGLRRKGQQEELVGEAAGNIRGRILFNGKELNFQSRASSVAAKASGLAHVDSPQSDDTGLQGQTLRLETDQEAAWRRLNPTLSCGQTRMKLKAMGPGAAGLQLDMGVLKGVARTLPLVQVPNSCGYSMRQNALGLILVVPYDGCSVVQENGYYVLPMSWMENPVQLACPMSQSSDSSPPATAQPTTAAITTTPVATTEAAPAMSLPANPMYPPYLPMYPPFTWPYYGQPMVPPAATAAPVMTSEPGKTTAPTTTTTPVATTGSTPAMKPPVNPINQPYFPLYPPFAWPYYDVQPMVTPATTTAPTTTAEPATTTVITTGITPAIDPVFPYYPNQYPYGWYPFLNLPESNVPPATTTTSVTTASPPPIQYYPPYFQYQPAGIPSQSEIFYPFIQPLYPQNPNPSTACSQQSGASVTPSTPAGPDIMASSNGYLDLSPYNGYNWLPFSQYMWHKNEHGKFPYAWKYRSQAGYLPGAQSPVQQYPGFLYQQPMPLFSYSSGPEIAQFN